MIKSKYKMGDKALHELTYNELLEAVDTIWEEKNKKITELEAQLKGTQQLLCSGLPIHSLWRGCVENALLLLAFGFVCFVLGG